MKHLRCSPLLVLFGLILPWLVSAGTSMDGPLLHDYDNTLRFPFRETVKCLNSSAVEEQWLSSDAHLNDGMAAELNKYLIESFPSDSYVRIERFDAVLYELTNVDKGGAARSFLRQQDYMTSPCDLNLEITGEATFAYHITNTTLADYLPTSLHRNLAARRSLIYSRVARYLADEHKRLVASTLSNAAEELTKRRLQTCPSVVESLYSFSAGEFMCSPNGPFFFGFAADGDLGIWKGYRKVWSANTFGDNNKVTLQSDGNLVVRDNSGIALWDSGTNGAVDSGGEVRISDSGEVSVINSVAAKTLAIVPELDNIESCATKLESIARLLPGEQICSPDEKFSFGLTFDGVLGIFHGPTQVWAAGTCCKGDGTYAHLQSDGNFVLYAGTGDVLWEAGTGGAEGSNAEITIDGYGLVTIANLDAGKTVTIEPFDDVQPPVDGDPKDPVGEFSCVEQVSGRIDLNENDFICSPDGRYRFGIDENGDLTLRDGANTVWSAGTCCAEDGNRAILQKSDGNLVVLNSNQDSLWNSGTGSPQNADSSLTLRNSGVVAITNPAGERVWEVAPEPVCLDQVAGEFVMLEGQFICSSANRFRFGMFDGDLSLFDENALIWSAGLSYNDGVYARMQVDGNLVVRNNAGDALWTSKTSENDGASLRLDDDGMAKILSSTGKELWSITGAPVEPPTPVPPTPSPVSPPTPSPFTDPSLIPCRDPVEGGVVMKVGEFICSPNGIFRFGLANDGNLALYDGSREIWSADTCCTGEEVTARMQVDGNLVVRTTSDEVIWSSGSANLGTGVVSLIVGDNAIVSIIDTNLGKLWSNTNVPPPTTKTPTAPSLPPTTDPPIFKAPPVDPSLLPCLDPVQGPVLLRQGDLFCSPSTTFKFGLTPDGDLALFEGSRKIWSADTCCTGDEVTTRLQVDGNLVVSKVANGDILWTSETANQNIGVASLIVGDDGVVTITDSIRGHIWSSAITGASDRVSTDSLIGKVMAGYQGWFMAKGDGGIDQWIHWSRPRETPSRSSITIDAWPDLRELDDDELYPTQFTYNDGSNAGLYSSYNAKTTERHTRWMKDYGVHGVFVQRFIGNARAPNWRPVIDKVLGHIRSGSEKHGRTFVNMYDIGNGNEATIVEDIINDWKHLVDDQHITKSKQYLHHRGRPLIAIWGFGFYDRLGRPDQVREIIDWFQNKAEDKYKATLMGGVPTGWRDLSRDSQANSQWASIYRSYDVISPWAVGRLSDVRTSNYHKTRYWEPDLRECNRLGIDYLPVVFPGFSFNNLKPKKPFNEIPRYGGRFMWHQMHNAVAAGSKMIYVAMFDEVDEGTAIFKIADNQQQTPREGQFLAADYDGDTNCPGDWWLNITGTVAGLVADGKDVPLNMPAYP